MKARGAHDPLRMGLNTTQLHVTPGLCLHAWLATSVSSQQLTVRRLWPQIEGDRGVAEEVLHENASPGHAKRGAA